MDTRPQHWTSPWEVLTGGLRFVVLMTPMVLLGLAVMRVEGESARWLGLGTAAMLFLAAVLMAFYRTYAPPVGPTILVAYLGSLFWLWFCLPPHAMDWYLHLIQGLLVAAPLLIVATYVVRQSGALLVKRAQAMAKQMANRQRWPSELGACRELPEVKAFREAIQYDAAVALELLNERKPQVRICALAALEFRKRWRPGQAEQVLAALRREQFPEIRVAAISALANSDDRFVIESLTEYLRDPDAKVRKATADALFWTNERRWSWIRFGVRKALSDPQLRRDPAMLREGQKLSEEAVNDLVAWASEKGMISIRAIQLLLIHYTASLGERSQELVPALCKTIRNPHAPPLLRIELARLLVRSELMENDLKEQLLDPANPAPMRLLVAESLLENGPHVRAIVCLREIAKLPNRELALATADVVQRRLGVDMGLAIGQALPSLNSGRAIEVTRRLMTWSAQADQVDTTEHTAMEATFERAST